MVDNLSGFAFISLLRDELEARGLCGLLESIARPESGVASIFLLPDVRGKDFFAAPGRQAEVDSWWGRHVPPTFVPVYLLCHEVGLADWLRGLDGVFIVAAIHDSVAEYAAWSVIEAEPAQAPLALASAAVERFGIPRDPSHPSVAGIFDRRDARLVADLRLDADLAPDSQPEFPTLVHVGGVRTKTRPRSQSSPDQRFAVDVDSEGVPPIPPHVRQAAKSGAKNSRLRAHLPLLLRRLANPGARPSGNGRRLD